MRARIERVRERLHRSSRLSALAVVALLAGVLVFTLAPRGHRDGDLLGATASAAPAALPPTQLLALPRSSIANGTLPLAVTLSAPAAADSPLPTLRPAVAGTWTASGDEVVFTPTSTLQPCSNYTLTVWADTVAREHATLGRRRVEHLHVACPPIAGMQQALARLGYLPAKLRTLYDVSIAPGRETRREAAEHAFRPPRGRLAPVPADAPPVQMGHLDATTRGALVVYQSDRGLEATGEPNYATWESVLSAVSADRRDPRPYTWVSVSESIPETLEVHRGDHVALTTPANTGVPGAETEQGIFPIYSRLVSTTMSGTDVDGTKYVVPDVPWVNYFNGGDAVHGYPRASYGYPQSNGCVELPIETAQTVFGMLALGDIVEVNG